jgi:hypothetical protein
VLLKLFRLGTAAFPVWDGAGAAAQGGRWNPPGIPVIYAAGTLSLAMLERLVQRRNLGRTLFVEAEVPAELAVEDLMARPPQNWRALGSPEAMAEGEDGSHRVDPHFFGCLQAWYRGRRTIWSTQLTRMRVGSGSDRPRCSSGTHGCLVFPHPPEWPDWGPICL